MVCRKPTQRCRHLTNRWSEQPPATGSPFARLLPFHFEPRALSATVAHLCLVRSLKRDAQIYLVDTNGQIAGRFAWTLIRKWVALSLLSSNSPVFLEGSSTWQTVADFPKLCQLPKSLARPDGAPGSYLSDNRLKLQSLRCQQSYAKTLGCPFDPAQIDRHLLSHII
jgi:hypothetical protein